jgi:ABC-2 type transport system permease protein
MPEWLRVVMLASPSTHYTSFAQSVLLRGAGLDVVWPQLLAIVSIGAALFGYALLRFRASMAAAR